MLARRPHHAIGGRHRERTRVVVLREGQALEADAALAPKADIRSVAIATTTPASPETTLIAFLPSGAAVNDLGRTRPTRSTIPTSRECRRPCGARRG